MDEIVWTKTALHDLNEIGAYIALDDPKAAERTVRRIAEAVAGLSFFPHIGRDGRILETRELIISDIPYIAVYRLRERIEILSIYHASRTWPERF